MCATRIDAKRRERETRQLLSALKDPRVLILTVAQFGFTAGSYGVGIWLPQIMKDARAVEHHDRFSHRRLLRRRIGRDDRLGGMGRSQRTQDQEPDARVPRRRSRSRCSRSLPRTSGCRCSGSRSRSSGITSARAIFWTIPTRFLTGLAAAGGLAFINSVATLGGFVGPYAMGWLRDATGSFSAGLMAMSGLLVLATVMSWSLKLFVTQE